MQRRAYRTASPGVVEETLGVTVDCVDPEASEQLQGYDFRHRSLTVLRNPAGIVGPAHRIQRPDHQRVRLDIETTVEATS